MLIVKLGILNNELRDVQMGVFFFGDETNPE